ncbi:Hypothetical protein PBC10988_3460 [Planctomycetales bacterium 10988]|nr:Hypothetical protein PBC10988_3460 [Planctomycetales bacterium 10988]
MIRSTVILIVLFNMILSPANQTSASELEDRYPSFSWDTVPLYMHIRKATSFNAEELSFISQFPLITFEKATGHLDHGSVEAGTLVAAKAIKQLNPATKILCYRNVFVHYSNYASNEKLDRIDGGLLVDLNSGSNKLVRNRVPAYDLSNPDVRNWWIDSCLTMTQQPAIDGLFIDGNIKALENGYLKSQIGAEKKLAVKEGYLTLMERTRKAVGEDKILVANLIRARFPQAGLEYMNYFDGSYLENFFHNIGNTTYAEYASKGIEAVQKAGNDGKIIAFSTAYQVPQQSDNKLSTIRDIDDQIKMIETDEEARKEMLYCLATFLICAEQYSYFRCDGYSADNKTNWNRWYPEFDKPLGPPQGRATRNGYEFTRRFEHASVWLDVEHGKSKIQWLQD